jgi:hypothetical protein
MRDRKKDRRFGIEAAWFKTRIIGQIGETDLRAPHQGFAQFSGSVLRLSLVDYCP